MALRLVIVGCLLAAAGRWILCAREACAQTVERSPHFERLDGLSHNTVLSVLQDRRGFLWIGTADGLNRYDGYEMETYRHDPRDSTSLSDNTIRPLAEGPDGTLWIGTPNGLNRYHPASGRFEPVPIARGRRTLPSNIHSLTLDEAGRVWFTVQDVGGLYCYDPAADSVRRYRPGTRSARGLAPGSLNRPFTDHDGRVWVITRTDTSAVLHRYEAGRDRFRPFRLSSRWAETKIAVGVGPSATWWTDGHTVGRFASESHRFREVLSLPEGPASPSLLPAREGTLLAARDSTLWIGTDAGLYRADPETGTVSLHAIDTTGTAALSNYVLALHEDRAGIVWVGTRSGLYRYDPNRKAFVHRRLSERSGGRTVMAIAEDEDGRRWIGTLGDGLLHLDRRTGTVRSVRGPPNFPGGNRIWAIQVGGGGRLWMGTEAGLLSFNPASGRFQKHSLPVTSRTGVPAVYTLAPGGDGSFWVGGGGDIYRFDPRRRAMTRHRTLRAITELTTVQSLHLDAHGRLWIGTENTGLLRYHPATDSLVHHPVSARDTMGLPGQTVWTLHPDRTGGFWLGTDLGLAHFDPSTETFSRHYAPDVLPGAHVYSILGDEHGRLWMGTNQGLVRYDPDTGSFRHYDEGDGVGNTEFNRRAALKGRDGTLTFGGLNGLTSFDPGAIRDNSYLPPVALTEVQIFSGGDVRTLPSSALGSEPLRLGYREATVELAFAALSFTHPENNRYAYRLEGFDRGWVQAGTRRVARYTNLPPGDYTFRVQGSNNDGVWNEQGASLRIVVTPPFWQRAWFRLLAAAVVLGLLYGAYRYRIAQVRRVERMRLRIATDLHDDVGSRLSSLALLSEMVRDRAALSEANRTELTRIGRVARQLIADLREIVWFVDPEHDEGALVWKMKNAAASLLQEVDYTFRCSSEDLLDDADAATRRNVFLIYKEALNNVARHAGADRVEIDLRREGRTVVLAVADDGVGFDDARAVDSHGLKNMRRRAAKIGADLEVESQPGAGTTLRLAVENNVFT